MISVRNAILSRSSTRKFIDDKAPSLDKIMDIIKIASNSPSGGNIQPWKVYLIHGNKRNDLVKKIYDKIEKFGDNSDEKTQFDVYPLNLTKPYKSRRSICGNQLYKTIGIMKSEKEKKS